MLAWEPGTGKTGTTLIALERLGLWPALVLTKKSIIWDAWMSDAEDFVPDMGVVASTGTPPQRSHALRSALVIPFRTTIVMNYESARMSRKEVLSIPWKAVVLDECTSIKNHKAVTTKFVRDLTHRANVEVVIALSGCPTPNHLLEIWSQIDAIQEGVLEWSYYAHRASRYYQPKHHLEWLWAPQNGAEDRLYSDLKDTVFWLRKKDVLPELPPQVDVVHEVELSKPEAAAYQRFRRELILELESGTLVGSTALVEVMKLRQMTAGIVRVGDTWEELGNTKVRAVLDIMDRECRDLDGKPKEVVIVCQFRYEVERFYSAIRHIDGRYPEILYGGLTDDERRDRINAFQDQRCNVLVVHPAAMAHGITLTAADTMIFASMGYSYEHYIQVKNRIHRIGQGASQCRYVHVLAKDTIDQKIYSVMAEKASVTLDLVRGMVG